MNSSTTMYLPPLGLLGLLLTVFAALLWLVTAPPLAMEPPPDATRQRPALLGVADERVLAFSQQAPRLAEEFLSGANPFATDFLVPPPPPPDPPPPPPPPPEPPPTR
ncbi:MAG: hypothetical protein EA425_01070, partial [Puniceicoccaceae bacterium]